MSRTYSRVPVVTRLEYLIDFLEGIQQGYKKDQLEQILVKRKTSFEAEKYKALGRGHPFAKGLKEAKDLLDECLKLGTQIDYVQHNGKPTLTSDGERFISLQEKEREAHFTAKFLNTYHSAPQLLLALKAQSNAQLDFIDVKRSRQADVFRATALQYGINVGIVSFQIVRNILTQLGLINWFSLRIEEAPHWRVYLTCNISDSPSERNVLEFTHMDRKYYVERTEADSLVFAEALWKAYMETTNYVPLRPVFYSNLRAKVGHNLRINDSEFDSAVKRIMDARNPPLRIVWSSGTLPYDRDSANLLKSLPPKSEDGQYLIYLKIDRRPT